MDVLARSDSTTSSHVFACVLDPVCLRPLPWELQMGPLSVFVPKGQMVSFPPKPPPPPKEQNPPHTHIPLGSRTTPHYHHHHLQRSRQRAQMNPAAPLTGAGLWFRSHLIFDPKPSAVPVYPVRTETGSTTETCDMFHHHSALMVSCVYLVWN